MRGAFPRPSLGHCVVLGAALFFISPQVIAQAPPADKTASPEAPPDPAPAPAPPAAPKEDEHGLKDEANKEQAGVFLKKGIEYIRQELWGPALTELLEATRLDPEAYDAVRYAAFCLEKLQRYDEALDMTEALLRNHASALAREENKDIKKAAEELLADVKELVGTITIKGAEPGASLIINGRFRGTAPLEGPLRVGQGHLRIRAYKEGYDPFGASVDIKGKQDLVITLVSQSRRGRLRVTEVHGRTLDVVVDGTVVGKTPWEGSVTVGDHVVLLRGNVKLDDLAVCAPGEEKPAKTSSAPAQLASVDLGTQPVRIPIHLRELSSLTLKAEDLDTWMRVEPTPAGATVAIDSVVVGRGVWEGRLRVGKHKIEIAAEGFIPVSQQVDLESRKRRTIQPTLARDPLNKLWRKPGSLAPAWAAYGIGVGGLGVFAVTGIMALNTISDVRSRCDGVLCPTNEVQNVERARTLGIASTVSLVVGGVGFAAGTFFLFQRPGGTAPETKGASQSEGSLSIGLGLGHVRMEGTF